jgi:hypothetical protein
MSVGVTTLEKRVTKTALLLASFIIISDEDKFPTPVLGIFLIALRLSFKFKRINQPDAAISQVYCLSLDTAQYFLGILMPIITSSTTAVAASGLPLERGSSSAVDRGRAGRPSRPQTIALLPPRSNGKPEAATAVVEFLMMGIKMPE